MMVRSRVLGAPLLLALLSGALLGGCSLLPSGQNDQAIPKAVVPPPPRTLAADGTPLAALDGVEIQKVAFRSGISSVTVETMAKQRGCTGGWGAGLVSEPGPVEVYRMTCESGKVFMATCELRQCRVM